MLIGTFFTLFVAFRDYLIATRMTSPDVKVILANERTFLAWLHMAVALGSIGAVLLGFGAKKAQNQNTRTATSESPAASSLNLTTAAGLVMLPVAAVFAIYAAYLFSSRLKVIRKREHPTHAVTVPILMGVALAASLSSILLISVL